MTRSAAGTLRAGRELSADLRSGDAVLLEGELGMGKTCFARGVAVGLGVRAEDVRSPSFTLVNPYQGRVTVYHIDLYRVDKASDLDELGLEEIFGGEGVSLVEWAERLGTYRPPRFLRVTIADLGGTQRRISIDDRRLP